MTGENHRNRICEQIDVTIVYFFESTKKRRIFIVCPKKNPIAAQQESEQIQENNQVNKYTETHTHLYFFVLLSNIANELNSTQIPHVLFCSYENRSEIENKM